MSLAVIIDIVIVLVLAGFTVYGAMRGLFQSLAGLVIIIVAFFGAAIIAGTFAAPVAKTVTPVIEKHFAERLDAVLENVLEETNSLNGMDAEINVLPTVEFLPDVMENIGGVLAGVTGSASDAMSVLVGKLIQSFVYGGLFILAFILLLLLLRVLCAAMGLMTKLPGINGLDSVGGAVLGLAEGALVVFLAVFMLRNVGVALDAEVLQDAHILRIFRENTPLDILFSLLRQ